MSRALPTGLVTFVFSDIEGSARRWESRREAMQAALRRHDRLLRGAIEQHHGRVFKTMGDQFCAVFANAPDAVAATLRAQRALAKEDWSAVDGLRVRMAVHTGVTDERGGDYFGPALNRVARLLSIGHGGQVLLSGFAADLAHKNLPPGTKLRDLGSHRLKDLAQRERVFQIVAPELESTFPELHSLGSPNNLPELMTEFLGRKTEVAAVKELVETSRSVTLTGAGGVGKTRTALEAARQLLDSFDDGVWLVELAPIVDPSLVPSGIAAVFNIVDSEGARSLVDGVIAVLKEKHLLIVLDNCEHVVAAAAEATDRILRACPNVRMLATSREALHVEGERIYALPSLELPPAGRITARKAAEYSAVALFVERARGVVREFALTDVNAPVVAEIVRRLDGIALAIELAAAQVSVLSVAEIAKRLDERFALLTTGNRAALPRQQTLRALIEWSYDLLEDSERELLAQLSVFRDGWTLEAANGVCGSGDTERWDALAPLSKLVDKSLVVVEREGADRRYRLLESTRQYALERLEEGGTLPQLLERHCRYFRDRSEELADTFWRINQEQFMAAALRELENYRAAIEWGLTAENDVVSSATIVANLRPLWIELLWREGSALTQQALDALGSANASIRARLLTAQTGFTADGGLGVEAGEEAVAIYEGTADRGSAWHVDAMMLLGNSTGRAGDIAKATKYSERALEMVRPLRLPRLTAAILGFLGFFLAYLGERERSHEAFDEALRLMREAGDPARMPLINFAELQFSDGDIAGAIASTRASLAIQREVGLGSRLMPGYANLAAYLLAAGELREAWIAAQTALDLALRFKRQMVGAIAIQHLVQIAARRGHTEIAGRLIGYVDAVYLSEKHPREPTERYGHERILALLRASFGEARIAALSAEGAALTEAVAGALARSIPLPDEA